MRIGKFRIARDLQDDPNVIALLDSMKIKHIQPSYDVVNVLEVLAEFEEFDDLNEGDIIPLYYFMFERDENNTTKRLPAIRSDSLVSRYV